MALLGFLVFVAFWALFTWGVIRADAAHERWHKCQMAQILGTPEWFAAQRVNGGSTPNPTEATATNAPSPISENAGEHSLGDA